MAYRFAERPEKRTTGEALHLGGSLGATRAGHTVLAPSAGPEVAAHESVHRAQHARWCEGAAAARSDQLEEEAERGAASLVQGRSFVPRLGAPPHVTLFAPPPFDPWTGVVATDQGSGLMARVSPDPAAEARGKFAQGTEVRVVGGHRETWLVVTGPSSSGVLLEKGYVLGKYIVPKTSAAAPAATADPKTKAAPAPPTREVSLPASALPPAVGEGQRLAEPPGLAALKQLNNPRNAVGNVGPGLVFPILAGGANAMATAVLELGPALSKLGKDAVQDAIIAALQAAQKAVIGEMRAGVKSLPDAVQGVAGTLVTVIDEVLTVIRQALLAVIGIVMGLGQGLYDVVKGLVMLIYTVIALIADFISGFWSEAHREAFDKRVQAIIDGFKSLKTAIPKAIDAWVDKFQKSSFDKGSMMIGELTGQIIALIATFAVGGEVAGALPKIGVPTFAFATTTEGAVVLVRTGAVAVDIAAPAVAAGLGGSAMMSAASGTGGGGVTPKPTAEHSAKLAADLEKAGIPRPDGHQAAHIVPTNAFTSRSEAVQAAIKLAQEKFDKYLGAAARDTEINGFWAPPGHAGTHTDRFFLELGKAFGPVRSRPQAEAAMRSIWKRIANGEFQ